MPKTTWGTEVLPFPCIRVGSALLDPNCATITGPSGTAELTAREFRLLLLVQSRASSAVTAEDAATGVWGHSEVNHRSGAYRKVAERLSRILRRVGSGCRMSCGYGMIALINDDEPALRAERLTGASHSTE